MADSPMEERDREREREISDGLTVFGYFFSSFFKMAATTGRRSASLSLSTKKRRVHARAERVWDSETLFDSHAHISREKRQKRRNKMKIPPFFFF